MSRLPATGDHRPGSDPNAQCVGHAEKTKKRAEEKTGGAMNHLQEQYDFCTKKLAELQRQTDLRQGEIKDCLAKGQKDKAKLVLKRKKIIEKQMVAVQNVRTRPQVTRMSARARRSPPPGCLSPFPSSTPHPQAHRAAEAARSPNSDA